jgi:hypothetical protein
MIDVHAALAALAAHHPIFHSEADFQHAFAWSLHVSHPDAAVRLERPVPTPLKVMHVDLVATRGNDVVACELKYKTRELDAVVRGEHYALQSHAAQPIGRYDFLMDVARLEAVRHALSATSCWAVLLTNDSAYWSEPGSIDGISASFSLSPGRTCSGTLQWGAATSAGTRRARERPITLAGHYCFQWRDYSTVDVPSRGRFRYLAVEVGATPPAPTHHAAP